MEYNIASVLKQLRKTSGCSANKVIEYLKDYKIEISAKTLYGYESGLSMPNADIFVALCKIYKCENPLDIFGNTSIKANEFSIIEKYRLIEQYSYKGKESVDYILNREYELAKEISKKQSVKDNIITYSATPIAARSDHESEAGEQEKMKEDIAGLKRPE